AAARLRYSPTRCCRASPPSDAFHPRRPAADVGWISAFALIAYPHAAYRSSARSRCHGLRLALFAEASVPCHAERRGGQAAQGSVVIAPEHASKPQVKGGPPHGQARGR